ncbi:hypothetical protein NPIL_5221 [Nephila pilipes]|uniref:Uncharacterized protein n=1 Tax=Nephila pilipes TaxID=299642 RepID=A0A8X6U296_NEPPI|nr:hypothetical protein NPIL_5221 [Nephila pilipes]
MNSSLPKYFLSTGKKQILLGESLPLMIDMMETVLVCPYSPKCLFVWIVFRLDMLAPYSSYLRKLHVVLASTSCRRKEILQDQLGMQFDAVSSNYDESLCPINRLSPYEYVIENATQKAAAVVKKFETDPSLLIIGADTVVVLNDEIIGKPKSPAHNIEILTKLSGKRHDVLTGVCLIYAVGESTHRMKSFCERTKVYMGNLPRAVIEAYVSSGEPESKAGGYAIQGQGSTLIESIDGDYFNVVGFPAYRFAKEIRELLQANAL